MKGLNQWLAAGMFIASSIYAQYPEPYESVRNLPATPYYVQDAYIYYDLIHSRNLNVIVDVESHEGGVARFIAQQANNLPSLTKIYCINAWNDCGSQKRLFHRFLSNVKQENTANLITPIRMNSHDAAAALNISADFISLVGGNSAEEIYKDILAWYPHLSEGGILCGNNWYENSVELGVTKAATALNLTLKLNNNVWYFEKNTP